MRTGLGGGWLFVLLSAIACGGQASDPRAAGGATASAGAPSDAQLLAGASGSIESVAGSAGSVAGSAASASETVVPPKTGDGKLADPGDTDNAGFGWDSCFGSPPVRMGSASSCAACPAASLGEQYLLFDFQPATMPPPGEQLPQVAFFYEPSEAAQGLWFDVAWVSGPKDGSVLSMWHAGSACQNASSARAVSLEPILGEVAGEWTTGCVPFAVEGQVHGFNLRIDTNAVIALDAVRFGPACPSSR